MLYPTPSDDHEQLQLRPTTVYDVLTGGGDGGVRGGIEGPLIILKIFGAALAAWAFLAALAALPFVIGQ